MCMCPFLLPRLGQHILSPHPLYCALQLRPVSIERLLIDGTIEEAVVHMAERKQALLTEADDTQVASVDTQVVGEEREEVVNLLDSIS